MLGLAFGGLHSIRRGHGSDVAASRPYRPGDDIGKIDWATSARLSLARGTDEFVVREHFAEEAPRVVVLADRRPSMALFGEEWPWLHKPAAIRQAVRLIGDSAVAARGLLGYYDEGEPEPYWHPPRSEGEIGRLDFDRPFGAPEGTVTSGLRHLIEQRRDLPAGTFVFVLSDFLVQPGRDDWLWALERRWEIVPVVIQDPVWEQSFPDVAGLVVPFEPARASCGSRESEVVPPARARTRSGRHAPARAARARPRPRARLVARAPRRALLVPQLGRPAPLHAGARVRRAALRC